jgi:hypothetical protein
MWTLLFGGPDWMPITPKTGSFLHADSQWSPLTHARRVEAPSCRRVTYVACFLAMLLKDQDDCGPGGAGITISSAAGRFVSPRTAHPRLPLEQVNHPVTIQLRGNE